MLRRDCKFERYWFTSGTMYEKQNVDVETGKAIMLSNGALHYCYVGTLWPDDASSNRPRIVMLDDDIGDTAKIVMFSHARPLSPPETPSKHPHHEAAQVAFGKLEKGCLTFRSHKIKPARSRSPAKIPRRNLRRQSSISSDDKDDEPPPPPPLHPTKDKSVTWYYETAPGVRSKRAVQRSTLMKKIKAGEIFSFTRICPYPRGSAGGYKSCEENFPQRFTNDDDIISGFSNTDNLTQGDEDQDFERPLSAVLNQSPPPPSDLDMLQYKFPRSRR